MHNWLSFLTSKDKNTYATDKKILLKMWQGIKNLLQYSVCKIPGLVAQLI